MATAAEVAVIVATRAPRFSAEQFVEWNSAGVQFMQHVRLWPRVDQVGLLPQSLMPESLPSSTGSPPPGPSSRRFHLFLLLFRLRWWRRLRILFKREAE